MRIFDGPSSGKTKETKKRRKKARPKILRNRLKVRFAAIVVVVGVSLRVQRRTLFGSKLTHLETRT